VQIGGVEVVWGGGDGTAPCTGPHEPTPGTHHVVVQLLLLVLVLLLLLVLLLVLVL
jgi:hypothetical protein